MYLFNRKRRNRKRSELIRIHCFTTTKFSFPLPRNCSPRSGLDHQAAFRRVSPLVFFYVCLFFFIFFYFLYVYVVLCRSILTEKVFKEKVQQNPCRCVHRVQRLFLPAKGALFAHLTPQNLQNQQLLSRGGRKNSEQKLKKIGHP